MGRLAISFYKSGLAAEKTLYDERGAVASGAKSVWGRRSPAPRAREAARNGQDAAQALQVHPPDRQEEATDTVLSQAESLSADWAQA